VSEESEREMAILIPKRKNPANNVRQLPTGSFSADSNGRIISTTIGQTYPRQHLENIAAVVLYTFRSAESVDLPLTEFSAVYGAFKISAREMKGGAIVFLSTADPLK
jgi:hypothetical protein